MVQAGNKSDREFDDVVTALLRLPVSNLEDRIKYIEYEIAYRQVLRDNNLSIIGTSHIRLKEELWHLRYIPVFNPAFNHISHLKREIALLEASRITERLGCFRDISGLKERLQQAKEELNMEKEKRKLVE